MSDCWQMISKGLSDVSTTDNVQVAVKESPQERLKRLMQAQLSKQIRRDNLTVAQKRAEAEREADARRQIERSAFSMDRRSPSPRYGQLSPHTRIANRTHLPSVDSPNGLLSTGNHKSHLVARGYPQRSGIHMNTNSATAGNSAQNV